jgi:hypothetical protein
MEKRFKMPIIASIFLLIVVVILNFLPLITVDPVDDLIPIIPGGTFLDVMICILIPFLFMIIMLFLGPIVTIVMVRMHKIIKLNKYDYFIIPIEKKISGKRILLRAIFPGLLAVNIAIYMSLSSGLNQLFYYGGGEAENIAVIIEYMAILLGIPIASLIILPIWMLQSSGLMSSKRIESYNRPVTPDIESVGQFYTKMLKGYVGISTIVAYSMILYLILTTTSNSSTILIVFIDPIVIILIFIPISLFFEMRSGKINARVDSYYKKLSFDTTPKTIKIE